MIFRFCELMISEQHRGAVVIRAKIHSYPQSIRRAYHQTRARTASDLDSLLVNGFQHSSLAIVEYVILAYYDRLHKQCELQLLE